MSLNKSPTSLVLFGSVANKIKVLHSLTKKYFSFGDPFIITIFKFHGGS